MSSEEQQNLRTVYDQLCQSYRAIDDFRAKLLGLLPLITGGGLVVLTTDVANVHPEALRPIGVFGALVTLGLFAYEIYGIRKCHALIDAAIDLEGEMELHTSGQFRARPRSVWGFVNEPFAAAIIYPAVMAAWTFMATYAPPASPVRPAVWVFGFGVTVVLGYSFWLRRAEIKESLGKQWQRIKEWWRDHRALRHDTGPTGTGTVPTPRTESADRERTAGLSFRRIDHTDGPPPAAPGVP